MFPISYLIFPLIFIVLYDKNFASYFYPFVMLSSIVGIIVNILLLTYIPFRKIFYNYFPYSLSIKSNFSVCHHQIEKMDHPIRFSYMPCIPYKKAS